MAGKLWNLAYVGQVGRYFVWRLLRLSGWHDSPGSKNQNCTVEPGREVHADRLFWKWAMDNELLSEGETLSSPSYTALKRPAKRYYLSDASLDTVGGSVLRRRYLGGMIRRKS